MKALLLLSVLLVPWRAGMAGPVPESGKATQIASIDELIKAAVQSGQKVTMKPGLYRLIDSIPLSAIPERRKRQEFQFITFSGSDNVFDLTGVTIELDTALRAALHAPIHTDEFLIKGSNNTLKGLTITSKGDGKALGGAVLGIAGGGTTLSGCTIHVGGSAPYGYGDLFGKGGLKHSGVHITGSRTRILGCRIFTKSFGHGFYLQEDASDVHFENCSVEGLMRSTDEILAETSGFAVQHKFVTMIKNRSGEARVLPGYMIAKSEDGFRTYGQHANLTLKNCTAKNMRGGFELRTKTAPKLENCTATGCERAFWVSNGAVLSRCRGDTMYGPLLFAEGDRASVDVELLPGQSKMNVHALAVIQGVGNKVAIKTSPKGALDRLLPILVGYGPPGMGSGMVPYSERNTRDLTLKNETAMPVVIGAKAGKSQIATRGKVVENQGKEIVVQSLP